jgi:hypothetical protein
LEFNKNVNSKRQQEAREKGKSACGKKLMFELSISKASFLLTLALHHVQLKALCNYDRHQDGGNAVEVVVRQLKL